MFKKILIGILLISGAMGFLLVTSPALRSQVSQVTGLAVAQTSTRWNNLKDSAAGDAQTSGIGAFGLYMWNGASFDRVRGTTANGIATDVTRVQGGTITPSDNFANPTTAITNWSLMAKWDSVGGNWDRWDGTVAVGGTITANQGTPNTLANAWPVKLSDGVNQIGTLAFPVRVDPTGTTAQPVSGAVTVSGTITANQGTAAAQAQRWPAFLSDGVNEKGTATNPLQITTVASSTLTTNQVTVDTTVGGVVIKAANSSRRSITIRNQGSTDMYIGASGVTTATGLLVKANETITLDRTSAEVRGIVAAGSTTAGYLEE